MLGLPTETEEDMRAIPELANEIAALYYDTVPKEQRNGKCQITISTSFFCTETFYPVPVGYHVRPIRLSGACKDCQ